MVTADTKKRLLHSLTCLQLLYSDQPALIYKFNFLFVVKAKPCLCDILIIQISHECRRHTLHCRTAPVTQKTQRTGFYIVPKNYLTLVFLATMTTKFVLMESDYTDNSPINNMTSCVINTIRLQQKRQKWTTLRHFFISHLLIFHVQSL